LVDRGGTCEHGSFARVDQDAERLTLSRRPGCGVSLLAQRFPCRFDRVERIALGAAWAAAADAPTDLDGALLVLVEESSKAGAIRACPLNRPHPPTRGALPRPFERRRVPAPVGAGARRSNQGAVRGEDRRAVPVAMRVDADDVVRLLCQHPSTSMRWGPSVPVWGSETAAAGL
jgi:hypothetical protein